MRSGTWSPDENRDNRKSAERREAGGPGNGVTGFKIPANPHVPNPPAFH